MAEENVLYEASQDEIEETMGLYEDLVIKLKDMSEKGDMNARCLHDIFVLTYECLSAGKILDIRNSLVSLYKSVVPPQDQVAEDEIQIKTEEDRSIN